MGKNFRVREWNQSDPCRTCVVRGYQDKCKQTPCNIHHSWYVGQLKAENKQLKESLRWTIEEDQPLPEDAQISAAHPMETKQHALYTEALRLVGAKKSKYGLVGLVNWLLYEKLKAEKALQDIKD